jgi:hypothetical protein
MYPQPPHGPVHPPGPGSFPPGYPPPTGYGWPHAAPPPPPPPRKNRTAILAAAAVVLLALVATPVVLNGLESAGTKDLGSGSATDPARWRVHVPAGHVDEYSTDVPGLTPGRTIDDAALAALDPRQLYWAMLARQGTRPVTDMVARNWISAEEYEVEFPANPVTHRVGIDWRTKAFIDESSGVTGDGTPDYVLLRCLGNDRYASYLPGNEIFGIPGRWDVKSAAGPDGYDNCADRMRPGKVVANSFAGDGIAPAGLSPEQMNAFISYLDGVPGLIEVSPPTTVEGNDGNQYIQLDVSLRPQDPRGDGETRMGGAFLNAAFAQTGNNPYDYPYSIDLDESQGRTMRYFVDPQTLLPAYAVMSDTGPMLPDGTPVADGSTTNSYDVYQYSWPDELDPAAMRAEGTPVFPVRPWPFEKVMF